MFEQTSYLEPPVSRAERRRYLRQRNKLQLLLHLHEAAERFYATNTSATFTYATAARSEWWEPKDEPHSVPQIVRALKDNRHLVAWPILKGQKPSAALCAELVKYGLLADDKPVELKLVDRTEEPDRLETHLESKLGRIQHTLDKAVELLEHIASGGIPSLAATVAAAFIADGMDGHFDSVVRWCHILAGSDRLIF